jgi:ABC-2 type transport system ATP-binding protein
LDWLRRLIREEADSGTSVIVSSHQLGEVERVCDRVGILANGRLIDVGSPQAIGGSRSRVRVVVGAECHDAAAAALAGMGTTSSEPGVFYVDAAGNAAVGAALMRAQVVPLTLVDERPSLEQRFLEVTGVRS